MGLIKQGILSQESIDFQSDIFFKQLVSVLKQASSKEIKISVAENELGKMIMDRFGLDLEVKLNTNYAPCIEIPDMDRNHPLLQQYLRNFMRNADSNKMLKNAKEGVIQGSVNIRTAKVTGVFSKICKTMHLPLATMLGVYKMTEEEIAAACLHEIGHPFTYFEYVSRTASTNQVLAAATRAMEGSDNAAERKAVFKAISKDYDLTDDECERLSSTTSTESVTTIVLIAAVRQSRSELGINVYDCNSWEQLADQFASRMGAGRYLVTGLSKLYQGSVSARSWPAYFAMEGVKLFVFGLSIGLVVTPAFSLGAYMLFLGWIWCVIDGPFDATYDRPGARLRRIRNDLVERLKITSKTEHPEVVASIHRDLDLMEEQLKNMSDKLPFYYAINKIFNSGFRTRMKAEQIQQELEAMVSNDLFVQATKLA